MLKKTSILSSLLQYSSIPILHLNIMVQTNSLSGGNENVVSTHFETALETPDYPPSTDETILLIDDVCTTGSTLDACACALKQAGVISVWGITLAKAR